MLPHLCVAIITRGLRDSYSANYPSLQKVRWVSSSDKATTSQDLKVLPSPKSLKLNRVFGVALQLHAGRLNWGLDGSKGTALVQQICHNYATLYRLGYSDKVWRTESRTCQVSRAIPQRSQTTL